MAGAAYDALLREGHEAIVAGDWDRARDCFGRAGAVAETAEVLDGLSQAAHFAGRYAEAMELKTRAFAAYLRRGDRAAAADVARWLAFLHGMHRGNMAAAGGWIARAERLLEEVAEGPGHGWLMLDRAPLTRDVAERERLAGAALAIARRHGDADLEFDALALLGHVHVVSGRVGDGMRLLDEAMAAVAGREVVGVGAIGDIYCRLLGACEHVTDVRRAEQWMDAVDSLVAWKDFVAPTCRCHYGGILIAVGRWDQAEEELRTALRMFSGGYRGERLSALVRLAELRVRQGRLEEAECLLDGGEWHPAARRSLAAIARFRGELELAEDLTRLCFEGSDHADPGCVPVFELLAEIQLDRGDVAAAEQTAARLAEIAGSCGDDRVRATADLILGDVMAARADRAATVRLRAAVDAFSGLGLPLEAARARLALARALVGATRGGAAAEARLALSGFERLGALHDADAAAALLRALGVAGARAWPRGHGELTRRETEVLGLLASGLSNAEIGERLFISRRTAEHHVARILFKLDLRSRSEAAAYAVRTQPQDT